MKATFAAIAAGSLLGSAAAGKLQGRHAGFHNRRHNHYQNTYPAYESSSSSEYVAYPSSSAAAYPTPSTYGTAYGTGYPVGTGYSVYSPVYGTGVTGVYQPVESCGCTTYTTTWYGEATLVDTYEYTPAVSTVYVQPTPVYSTPAAPVYSESETYPVPTPVVTVCPTPGTYTFPATTVTLTETATVVAYTTAAVTPGECSYGGITTSVTTATTVTCPYVSEYTTESTSTYTVLTTTYVCPSAGEYTIVAPHTTSASESTTVVYPVPTTYVPGTYTAPEQTITITKTSEVYVCPYETVSPSYSSGYAVYSTPVYASPEVSSTPEAVYYSTPTYEAVYSTPVSEVYSYSASTPCEETVTEGIYSSTPVAVYYSTPTYEAVYSTPVSEVYSYSASTPCEETATEGIYSSTPVAVYYSTPTSEAVYSTPVSEVYSYGTSTPCEETATEAIYSTSSAAVYYSTSEAVYYSTPAASYEAEYSSPSSYAAPKHTKTTSAYQAAYTKPASGGISTQGNQWAMTYTPYTTSGECKSESDVYSDIEAIYNAGFPTVRIYATDCDALPNVGGAVEKYGMRLILGIFIDSSGISGCSEQVDEIVAWGKFDLVDMIVIGNEAIFNGYCSASELSAFITSCKSKFQAAGYTGPCTTTEPLNILQESGSALCGAIDVVGANIQPYFNADCDASDAGSFVKGQLELVADVCPGLDAYNLECGWPSAGGANGAAVPGKEEQKKAIESILNEVGDHSVIFSYQDDGWKDAGEYGVEQHFGCVDLF